MRYFRRLQQRVRGGRSTAGDDGMALITVLLMMAALAGLTSTIAVVAIDNTQNAHADRQGTAALGVAEGGVAQALAYIRKNGVMGLTCSPTCTANPWGNSTNPQTVTVPGYNAIYKVWIEKIVGLDVNATYAAGALIAPTGKYRVHSTGTNGSNPGTRSVTVDVDVTPFQFPIGVSAHTVSGGGAGSTRKTSIFSDGCINQRDKMGLVNGEIDEYLGIPTAAYSTVGITKSNSNCTNNNDIHKASPCNTEFPYDQNPMGAYEPAAYATGPTQPANWWNTWLSSSCKTTTPTPADGSFIDGELMSSKFAFPATQLDSSYYDALKSQAIEQGFYYTSTNSIPAVLQPANAYQTYPHPVIYYDFSGSGSDASRTVNLSDLTGYSHPPGAAATAGTCTQASAVVVIRNGHAKLNSNTVVAANVFLPEGEMEKLNGTAKLIGTLYADTVDLTGTGDFWLDDCFLQNLPGSLLAITTRDFVEADR